MKIHPVGSMNVLTKFHCNQSNNCGDTSLKTTNVKLMVALEEKSGDRQSHQVKSSGNYVCLYKISWQVVVDILKWWTDRQTDRATLPSKNVSLGLFRKGMKMCIFV